MAYDRYDRGDDRSRWSEDHGREHGWRDRDQGRDDERGFFERAGDHIASWFGDEDAERRVHQDEMRDDPNRNWRSRGSSGPWSSSDRGSSGPWSSRDRDASRDRDQDRYRDRGRDYRPMTGDYSRHESEQFFSASGVGRGERGMGQYDRGADRSESLWGRDDYRRTSRAGTSDRSDRSRHDRDFDPHYHSCLLYTSDAADEL